jgi:Mg-chelatase subunit ChlD
VKEGADAERAVSDAARRTLSRERLAVHRGFDRVSPDVGALDEVAFDEAMAEDPDAALAMLADMGAATDPRLRSLARRLAGRVSLEIARPNAVTRRGTSRMTEVAYGPDAGDIELDASLEVVVDARKGIPVDAERLRVRDWRSSAVAWSLVVDRSGSMGGAPLATAAVAAAAVALRSGGDHSVLAFARDVVVLRSQDGHGDVERVVGGLLALRGHGTTDLAAALRAARSQLDRSPARDRVMLVFSDCRSTTGEDASRAAIEAIGSACTIAIVAPAEDHDEAADFASAVGARFTTVSGPSDVPRAVAEVLADRSPG